MPLKTSREVLKKLQPKLRMIADGDADVNIVRAERTAALIVESPSALKKVETCRGADAVPVTIEGVTKGEWFAHADLLDRPWRPRTVLLSPFDDLVSDRDHTEALFDFFFRIEIYVPKAKRQWGYFVLPILRGDRLVGRIDPLFDRRQHTLRINAIFMQPETTAADRAAVDSSIHDLARWLKADQVVLPRVSRAEP